MADSRVRAKGQVTIPREIRERAHIEEGDPVEFEMVPEGILLRPQKVIDSAQTWFWSSAWQAGEREASADIAEGRVKVFESEDDFLESLDP
jgi:AbrB family looped-hinge helix DNA binding protein